MDSARKRLIFRAHRRGFREMDLIMGAFADAYVPNMSEDEVDEFERLLAVPDWEVYSWILGKSEVPHNYRGPVIELLCRFDYSAQL